MDIVSYVEFQNNFKIAIHAHKATLRSLRSFWRLVISLQDDELPVYELVRHFHRIDRFEQKTMKTYQTMLEKFPKSTKLLRGFGQFLSEVKNDSRAARK